MKSNLGWLLEFLMNHEAATPAIPSKYTINNTPLKFYITNDRSLSRKKIEIYRDDMSPVHLLCIYVDKDIDPTKIQYSVPEENDIDDNSTHIALFINENYEISRNHVDVCDFRCGDGAKCTVEVSDEGLFQASTVMNFNQDELRKVHEMYWNLTSDFEQYTYQGWNLVLIGSCRLLLSDLFNVPNSLVRL